MNHPIHYYWPQHVFRNIDKDIGCGFFHLFQVLWLPVVNMYLGLPPHKNVAMWSVLQQGHSRTLCLIIYYSVKCSCSHVQTLFARWACTMHPISHEKKHCSVFHWEIICHCLETFQGTCSIHFFLQKARFNKCWCCDTTPDCHLWMTLSIFYTVVWMNLQISHNESCNNLWTHQNKTLPHHSTKCY
jgi:hypothetical protein